MQEIVSQLAETKAVIAENAKRIARLQDEVARIGQRGGDATQVREMLSLFHMLHMQVLAVQAMLLKALKEIGAE